VTIAQRVQTLPDGCLPAGSAEIGVFATRAARVHNALMKAQRRTSTFGLILTAALCLTGSSVSAASEPAGARWMPRHGDTTLRVLTWNVSRKAFFDAGEHTEHLLASTAADILLLDEMSKEATPAMLAALLDRALPGSLWHVVIGEANGKLERGSISSRWPLRRAEQFDGLHYRQADMDRWIAAGGRHAELLRQTLPLGVAVAGAIAEIEGRQVLLVSFDLQCCGDSPESWEESRRLVEARLIRHAIDATVAAGKVDAIILGGDANNVQGDEVLRILQGSPPDLVDADARREDGSDWTWDGRGTPFQSKKMDHLMHSPSPHEMASRVFDPEGWPEAWLARYGVQREWSGQVSAHRAVVVDLSFAPEPEK
jgi:hypothetical protein